MEQLHGVAEQDFRVQIFRAIGADEVVQIQRQRRVGQALAARGVARWQALVAPAEVGCHLVQKKIDLSIVRAPCLGHAVGWQRADVDRTAEHATDVVIDQTVVQYVAQHGRDTGDRQSRAHARPRCAR